MAKGKGTPGDDDALIDFLDEILDEDRRDIIFSPGEFSRWWGQQMAWNSGGRVSPAQREWGQQTMEALGRRFVAERVRVDTIVTRAGRSQTVYRIGGRFASAASVLGRLFGGR